MFLVITGSTPVPYEPIPMRLLNGLFFETIFLRLARYWFSDTAGVRLRSSLKRMSEGTVCFVSSSKVWTFNTLSISLIWASLGPMCLSVNDSDIINVFLV